LQFLSRWTCEIGFDRGQLSITHAGDKTGGPGKTRFPECGLAALEPNRYPIDCGPLN